MPHKNVKRDLGRDRDIGSRSRKGWGEGHEYSPNAAPLRVPSFYFNRPTFLYKNECCVRSNKLIMHFYIAPR